MNLKVKLLKALTIEDWEELNNEQQEDLVMLIEQEDIRRESRHWKARAIKQFHKVRDTLLGVRYE